MSLLSIDLEGNAASSLMQVLAGIALSHLHRRRLCLPEHSIRCKGLVQRVDADAVPACGPSRVYTLAPVENVFRTVYGFGAEHHRLGISSARPAMYQELFAADRFTGCPSIHLTGHTTKDTTALRPYRDVIQRGIQLATHPAVEPLRAFKGRTLVSVHVRRGDVDYLHFILQGAHFALGVHHYKAWLDRHLPLLDRPLVYIATNGSIENMRREFARYSPVTAADLGLLGTDAVQVDHQVMRQSQILLCGPGTFSLTAAMFATVPQQTFYYSHQGGAFQLVDPWQVKFFTRDPHFPRVRIYPFGERGMLRSLVRHYLAMKRYVRATRAAFKQLLYDAGGRPRRAQEILDSYCGLDGSARYYDKITAFVRMLQERMSEAVKVRPMVYELFY